MRQRKIGGGEEMRIKKVEASLQPGTIPALPLGCCGALIGCGGKGKITIY